MKKHERLNCGSTQTTTVSLTGLPVLRTLYKSMSMHKSTNNRNREFCVL